MDILYFDPNDTIGVTDSESIQNAVDRARACGINKVVIPRYNLRADDTVWVISEAIRLPSDMTVVLDNCYLKMADGVMTNFFRNENAYTELASTKEGRQYGITIKGEGLAVLDGGNPNGLTEETSLVGTRPHVSLNNPIFLLNVEGFTVENISIINPRYYGVRLEFASRGRVRDLFIDAKGDAAEQGGVDIRNGCRDLLIENLSGQVSGNMVRLAPIDTPRDDGYNFICEGEVSDICAVSVKNISGNAIGHSLVSLGGSEGMVYNLSIDNVSDSEISENENSTASLVSLGVEVKNGTRPSLVRNISLSNLRATYTDTVVSICGGVANSHITNVHALGAPESILSFGRGSLVQNATLDGVYFAAAEKERSCVADLSKLAVGDAVKSLYITNAHLTEVGAVALICEDAVDEVDISTFAIFTDDGGELETRILPHVDAKTE